MDSQQVLHLAGDRGRRGCLVEGCPCKDARIVSKRRPAFFAAWAQQHGETADRSFLPELDWRLPTLSSPAASSKTTARKPRNNLRGGQITDEHSKNSRGRRSPERPTAMCGTVVSIRGGPTA